MAFPIAPQLGAFFVTEAAKQAALLAAAAQGGSKGEAPTTGAEEETEDGRSPVRGALSRLLGIPLFDPAVAKASIIQGAVITALVVLFFFGLYLFVIRSVKLK